MWIWTPDKAEAVAALGIALWPTHGHWIGRTPAETFFLHEEEVPRAGARVFQAFQRSRWTDGRVVVWLGVRKQTGRGEGSSGLGFDELVDVPPAS